MMKTSSMSRIPVTAQRIAQLLASKLSCLYVILSSPTLMEEIGNALNVKRYITLPELGELYRRISDERRAELRALLDQIAVGFDGWLAFFKSNRFRLQGAARLMVIEELISSAKAFAEKKILFAIEDIDEDRKDQLMAGMKREAVGWEEIIFLLNLEFHPALFRKALKLARGDKGRLLFLSKLTGIGSHRLAYIYHCLLELKNKLTHEELYSMYNRLGRRSILRPAILELMEKRSIPFAFWLRVYQIGCRECGDDEKIDSLLQSCGLMRLSWKSISAADIAPETIVHTCNNYRERRLNAMLAQRLDGLESNDSLAWEALYEISAPSAPEIRGVILNKQLTIALSGTAEGLPASQTAIALRAIFIKSAAHPLIAKKALGGMIRLLPDRRDAGRLPSSEAALFNSIKNLLTQVKNTDYFRKLLKLLAPKIGKEQWVELFLQFRSSPILRNQIMKKYKGFLIKEMLKAHPDLGRVATRAYKFRRQFTEEQAREIDELKKIAQPRKIAA